MNTYQTQNQKKGAKKGQSKPPLVVIVMGQMQTNCVSFCTSIFYRQQDKESPYICSQLAPPDADDDGESYGAERHEGSEVESASVAVASERT